MKRTIWIFGLFIFGITLAVSQEGVEELEDQAIADAIEDKFRFDHAVDVNRIDVEVVEGIVELTGTVNNLKAKERATSIAELVKGVRAVSNRIDVAPPVVMNDDWIQEQVQQALLKDPATDSYEVEVSVMDNVVSLRGTVGSYKEKQLAANVAKSVKGVVDLMNYIQVDYTSDRSDWEIRNEIQAALKWNALVDDGLIEVEVNDGQVILSGTVGSASEKSNAYFTSWVAGVEEVNHDNLEVQWWAEDEELRKNKFVAVADDEIAEAIKDAALLDPRITSFEINPEVDNGWVTLRGMVNNLKAKLAAGKLAEHTTGVIGVTNRIKVRTGEQPADADLRSEVNTALAQNSITESWEIDVSVNNGIATLTGVVDSYLEKNEAEWVASGVEGVTDVNNRLEVNYPHSYYWWGYYPYYNLYVNPPDTDQSLVPDDERIRQSVESEIWWSPFVDRDQVHITVDKGRVTLEGTVDSWREYRKAAENAWEGGAWSVDNQLVVNER